MLRSLSQADQALHDTLIHRADGTAFDALGELYGFPRVPGTPIATWRHALRSVAYGPRGTVGATWAAVELGLRADAADRTIQVTLSSSAPHTATFVSGPTGPYASGITCDWVGRLARLRYHTTGPVHRSSLVRIEGPVEIASGSSATTIHLCPVTTRAWEAEPCTAFTGTISASLELLPFAWQEPSPGPVDTLPAAGAPLLPSGAATPLEWLSQPQAPLAGRCLVRLLVTETSYSTPPTYLLDPAGVDRATFPSQPDGGIVMDLFGAINDTTGTLVEVGDPLGDGPAPVYLADDTGLATLQRYFDPILASGVDFEATVRDFCAFDGLGYTSALRLDMNELAEGAWSHAALVEGSATGVIDTQTVWPSQRAYVFSGTGSRKLTSAAAYSGTLEWTYADGGLTGTTWGAPSAGEDLVLETAASPGGPWTEVWRAEAAVARVGWSAGSYALPSSLYFRFRQVTYNNASGDAWAIGRVRVS